MIFIVSIVRPIRWRAGRSLGGLASLCKTTLSFNSSHLFPNGPADPLDIEILEL